MRCRECGQVEDHKFSDYIQEELDEKGICFDCYFWLEKLAIKDEAVVARIGGVHFVIGEENPDLPSYCKGYGGARFTIRFHDGRIVETTNLWCQGKIPEHMREQLPDNAVFVKKEV